MFVRDSHWGGWCSQGVKYGVPHDRCDLQGRWQIEGFASGCKCCEVVVWDTIHLCVCPIVHNLHTEDWHPAEESASAKFDWPFLGLFLWNSGHCGSKAHIGTNSHRKAYCLSQQLQASDAFGQHQLLWENPLYFLTCSLSSRNASISVLQTFVFALLFIWVWCRKCDLVFATCSFR